MAAREAPKLKTAVLPSGALMCTLPGVSAPAAGGAWYVARKNVSSPGAAGSVPVHNPLRCACEKQSARR